MEFIKKIYVLIAAVLFSTACSKDLTVVSPDGTADTEKLLVVAGDEVVFDIKGNADFIVFYPDFENSKTGIPVKSYQELPLEKFVYIYEKPGVYTAKLLFRNAIKREEIVKEQIFTIEVLRSDWELQKELTTALEAEGKYDVFLSHLSETTLPKEVIATTMFLVGDADLQGESEFNVNDYIIGQPMTLQEIIDEPNVTTLSNSVLDVVKIGQDVYINGTKVVDTFVRGNNQFIVLEDVYSSTISKLLSVKRVGDELYIASKFTQDKDLLIRFGKMGANDLVTFNRVGYAANGNRFPLLDPQKAPSTTINTAINIGAISLGTNWTGGNFVRNVATTAPAQNRKTAETETVRFFADGQEVLGAVPIYAEKVEVHVQNKIYDARDVANNGVRLTTPLCSEDIVYTIEGNTLKVDLSHKYVNSTAVNIATYYGMTSAAKGKDVFFPNGETVDFMPRQTMRGTKENYPRFNRFVQRNLDDGWYEAAYMLPNVGLGDHSSIPNNGDVYLLSNDVIFHWIMRLVNGVSNGAAYNWTGIYTWFTPLLDNEQLLAYEMRKSGKNQIVIDVKQAFTGVLNLPKDYKDKSFTILDQDPSVSSVISDSEGVKIAASGSGTVLLEF